MVKVTDVQEPGTATINWRQPEATTEIRGDEDRRCRIPSRTAKIQSSFSLTPVRPYQWFVPKVSRPVLENDDHWQNATGTGNGAATFQPDGENVDKFLRVRITAYTDAKGEDKLFVMSESFPVRARCPALQRRSRCGHVFDPSGNFGTRNVKEDSGCRARLSQIQPHCWRSRYRTSLDVAGR